MVADNKPKKLKISLSENNEEDDTLSIDQDLVLSILQLQEAQDELEKINEKASDEILKVCKKYNEIRKPVYDKRNEIIKSIPEFWSMAFLGHPDLSEVVSEEDHQIFKHLSCIDVEDLKDVKSGFSITFNFIPNPYFDNTKLTKTFTFIDEGVTKITSTSINWKKGMGVQNGVDNKKEGNKRGHHSEESFFRWFNETRQLDDEDIHDEIAETIRDDLWLNPLVYFSNFQMTDEEFEGDDDDNKETDDTEDNQDDDKDEEE